MRLRRMYVRGFASFQDTGWIEFSPKINLIVGQNNSGKTALLRTLDRALSDDRHRNLENYETIRLPPPFVEYEFDVSGVELETAILSSPNPMSWPIEGGAMEEVDRLFATVARLNLQFEVYRSANTRFVSSRQPSHGLFDGPVNRTVEIIAVNGSIIRRGIYNSNNDTVIDLVTATFDHKLFRFNAERSGVGKCPLGDGSRLSPNASNLPQVLALLQGEKVGTFQRLIQHLREIFPTVATISVTTLGQELEIRVWATENTERAEWGFPLEKSGTGVAQVIAILTVMMTLDNAIIVIDEISSFLHPSAAKSLLRIIQMYYSSHQYIISTHSPEVISSAQADSIHLIRRHGFNSEVVRLDLDNVRQLVELAEHLGIAMTDVFAADHVIWVEGSTEELCLRYLFETCVGPMPQGVVFSSVVSTGEFIRKDKRRELVFEIYERISKVSAPLVKEVTFSFDREGLTEEQRQELTRRSRGKVKLLPRRNFECYLLDPSAIAAFIVGRLPDLAGKVNADDVKERIQTIAQDPKFRTSLDWDGNITDEGWLAQIDAAALIDRLCSDITDARLEFVKKLDSLEILKHVVANNVGSLAGISELHQVSHFYREDDVVFGNCGSSPIFTTPSFTSGGNCSAPLAFRPVALLT